MSDREPDSVSVVTPFDRQGKALRALRPRLNQKPRVKLDLRWTRPYRPQTNGKAERFIRTTLAGRAYRAAYRSLLHRAVSGHLAVLHLVCEFATRANETLRLTGATRPR